MNIIAGPARGVELAVADDSALRPTSGRARKALFDSLGCFDGLHVLDLFAGSGALALEAASRGAASVTMLEISPAHISCIQENCRRVAAAGVSVPTLVINGDTLSPETVLPRLKNRPDIVFGDPPYAESDKFFHRLLDNDFFCGALRGATLIWEIPDAPGSAGKFITTRKLQNLKLRRFGSTMFLFGVI